MTTRAVPPWNPGEIQSFHPEMTLSSSAPLPELLTLLEAGLKDASFKVKERSDEGFRARYIDWFDLASGGINRTTLEVAATPGADRAEVVVRAKSVDGAASGRKRASQGLSTAVEALRVRGHDVSASPWRAAGQR